MGRPAWGRSTRLPRALRVYARNRASLLGAALGLTILAGALLAPLLAPHNPFDQSALNRLAPPDGSYLLGRDTFGRDILSRLLYAARVSLTVGLGAVAIGATLGTVIGLSAGYSRSWLESLLMRAVDVLMSFPSLLLGLLVLALLGAGLEKMILAIGLVLASPFARVVHGTTLSLRNRDFVEAARSLGAGHLRVMHRHILPNLLGEAIVLASLLTATAIRIEASLSFIGLGVSPPTPTWGNMIRDGTPLLLNAPWLSLFPGLAVLLTVLAFNLIGDGLRDVLDPRTS